MTSLTSSESLTPPGSFQVLGLYCFKQQAEMNFQHGPFHGVLNKWLVTWGTDSPR